MKTYTKDELAEVLRLHSCWLADPATGFCADLRGANLRYANLRDANLSDANLRDANLSYADLGYADLGGANLGGANLYSANLSDANLYSANLRGADLRDANLGARSIVPEVGSFVAFKKVEGGHILKLEVTEDAKRVGGLTGRKCRASKAKVLGVEGETEMKEFKSNYDSEFIYRIGETVEVADFSDDIREECAEGIHFFITKKEAEEY